jgi:hypothetical protein
MMAFKHTVSGRYRTIDPVTSWFGCVLFGPFYLIGIGAPNLGIAWFLGLASIGAACTYGGAAATSLLAYAVWCLYSLGAGQHIRNALLERGYVEVEAPKPAPPPPAAAGNVAFTLSILSIIVLLVIGTAALSRCSPS